MGKAHTQFNLAIRTALRNWTEPTWAGLEFFEGLQTPKGYGFSRRMPLVAARKAINAMLLNCMAQLAEMKPEESRVLQLRFLEKVKIFRIAAEVHVSVDRVNRLLAKATKHLAGMIEHEEKFDDG